MIQHEHPWWCAGDYSSLLFFMDIHRTAIGLCKRSCDPSVYLCTDGMASIVFNANSEHGSLPILFLLEKVCYDADLLCGISREIFMTADTISVRVPMACSLERTNTATLRFRKVDTEHNGHPNNFRRSCPAIVK